MVFDTIQPFVRSVSCEPYIWCNKTPVYSYDCRLFYILKGKGTVYFDRIEKALNTSTLLLFPCGTRYDFKCSKADMIELFTVNFDYSSRHQYRTDPLPLCYDASINENQLIEKPVHPIFTAPICIDDMQFIENDLMKMLQEFRMHKKFYQDVISTILKEVLITAARVLRGDNSILSSNVQKLIDYIHIHYAKNLSNKELADILCYHPCYINRLMKEETGMTIQKYLHSYRISVASKLITTTDLPLGEIALMTGFKNSPHFSTCFKKSVGKAPGQYRHSHKNEITH